MEKRNLVDVIDEVEAEVNRFMIKLNALQVRYREEKHRYPNKNTAAVRRAALDLKQELTKITQSTSW